MALGILLLAAPYCLRADEASKLAKAAEYFELAQFKQNMSQLMQVVRNQTNAQMLGQMTGSKLPPELRDDLNRFQDEVYKVLDEALGWESMKSEYARLYAEAFTEEEIDGMLAFYRSPAGRAMVAKTPQLMQATSEISQRRLAAIAPQVQDLTRKWKEIVAERMRQEKSTSTP